MDPQRLGSRMFPAINPHTSPDPPAPSPHLPPILRPSHSLKTVSRHAMESVCSTMTTLPGVHRVADLAIFGPGVDGAISDITKKGSVAYNHCLHIMRCVSRKERRQREQAEAPAPRSPRKVPSFYLLPPAALGRSPLAAQSVGGATVILADIMALSKATGFSTKLIAFEDTLLGAATTAASTKTGVKTAVKPQTQCDKEKAAEKSIQKDEMTRFIEAEALRRRGIIKHIEITQCAEVGNYTPQKVLAALRARSCKLRVKQTEVKDRFHRQLLEYEAKNVAELEAAERQHAEMQRKKDAGERCLRVLRYTAVCLALRLVRMAANIAMDSRGRESKKSMSLVELLYSKDRPDATTKRLSQNTHTFLSPSQHEQHRKSLEMSGVGMYNKDVVMRRRVEQIARSVRVVMRGLHTWVVTRHAIASRVAAIKVLKNVLQAIASWPALHFILQFAARRRCRDLRRARTVIVTAVRRRSLEEGVARRQWEKMTQKICVRGIPPPLVGEIIQIELKKRRDQHARNVTRLQLRRREVFPSVPLQLMGHRFVSIDPSPTFHEAFGFDPNGVAMSKYASKPETSLGRGMVVHHARAYVAILGAMGRRRMDPRIQPAELKHVATPQMDRFMPLLPNDHLERVVRYTAAKWELTLTGSVAGREAFFKGMP